jgi:hypothetical protein
MLMDYYFNPKEEAFDCMYMESSETQRETEIEIHEEEARNENDVDER